MKRLIEGCGYNPEAHVAAFRFKDMGVIVERNKIIINNAEDEATAQTVMDWLKGILSTADAGNTGTARVRAKGSHKL